MAEYTAFDEIIDSYKNDVMRFNPFIKREIYHIGKDMVINFRDWKQDSYTFSNGKISFWTANGIMLFKFYTDSGAKLGYFESKFLMKCIRKSTVLKGLEKKG